MEKREGENNIIIIQPQKCLKFLKNSQILKLLSCAPNFPPPRTLRGHKIYNANYHSRHDSDIVCGCFYSLTEMIFCGIWLTKVQNIYFVAFKEMLVNLWTVYNIDKQIFFIKITDYSPWLYVNHPHLWKGKGKYNIFI